MKTYQTGKRANIAFLGVPFILVGLLFAGGGIASVVSDLFSDDPPNYLGSRGIAFLALVGAGSAAAYLGWLYLWRRAFEVRLPGDGSIELDGLLRHQKIAGAELVELKRSVAKIVPEDHDPRELRVVSHRGTMLIPYFENIEMLIADIQAQTPHITVTGNWPNETS